MSSIEYGRVYFEPGTNKVFFHMKNPSVSGTLRQPASTAARNPTVAVRPQGPVQQGSLAQKPRPQINLRPGRQQGSLPSWQGVLPLQQPPFQQATLSRAPQAPPQLHRLPASTGSRASITRQNLLPPTQPRTVPTLPGSSMPQTLLPPTQRRTVPRLPGQTIQNLQAARTAAQRQQRTLHPGDQEYLAAFTGIGALAKQESV